MRFYYKIEPEKLTIDEYCKLESELIFLSKIKIIPLTF
jgi:hypothetical protein